MDEWDADTVSQWAFEIGLSAETCEQFHKSDFQGVHLRDITQDGLQDLGIDPKERGLVIRERDLFLSRRHVDVDGRICVRTTWYKRLFASILAQLLCSLTSTILGGLFSAVVDQKIASGAAGVLVLAGRLAINYQSPGQDFAFWLSDLYLVDKFGSLASFTLTLKWLSFDIVATLMGGLGALYFIPNLFVWAILGDPINDLILETTVCAFQTAE